MDIIISEKPMKDVYTIKESKDYFIGEDNSIFYEAKGDFRKILEKKQLDLMFNFEYSNYKDFIFYRNSGFNQVLAKLAKKRDIVIGFSFSKFKGCKNKYQILGRLQQNYLICKKYNVKTKIASLSKKKEDPFVLKSFERLLNKKSLY